MPANRGRGDDEGTLRLFVAVELPDEVRGALVSTIDALRRAGAQDGLRWVRPEGVHVTLKFLGAVPLGRVLAIVDALKTGLRAAAAFDLQPAGVGSFGGRRNLRVVWVGVGGDIEALSALAARVEAALAPLGFPPEQRPFAAHLTLARVWEDAPSSGREALHALLARFEPPPYPTFHVEHVSLMQSTLKPRGAVYRALATFPLQ